MQLEQNIHENHNKIHENDLQEHKVRNCICGVGSTPKVKCHRRTPEKTFFTNSQSVQTHGKPVNVDACFKLVSQECDSIATFFQYNITQYQCQYHHISAVSVTVPTHSTSISIRSAQYPVSVQYSTSMQYPVPAI